MEGLSGTKNILEQQTKFKIQNENFRIDGNISFKHTEPKTWTLTKKQIQKLIATQNAVLQSILKIRHNSHCGYIE